MTAMAFEAEQYRQLRALGKPVSGPARITALGVAVHIYPDADAFAASPGSQLDPSADPPRNPAALPRQRLDLATPAGRRILHLLRPVRRPAQAQPRARLSGTVLHAGRRICALTGQPF